MKAVCWVPACSAPVEAQHAQRHAYSGGIAPALLAGENGSLHSVCSAPAYSGYLQAAAKGALLLTSIIQARFACID